MFFYAGERFPDLRSELAGNSTESIKNILFSRCLRLLIIEGISGAAVLCAQPQHVLASQSCD